ncbi:MAG: VOC family protein [Betaproteobacteria bacterium]|nr:MAG: VOC family protein [Betaproteobacteria bacterium]
MTNATEPYWNPMVPELIVASVERSLVFYKAAGFSVRFQRTDPQFAYLELGNAQLMLEQQHSQGWTIEPLDRPLGRGVNFQIEVPDAEAVLNNLEALNAPIFRSLKDTWYQVSPGREEGQREFLAQDPDGYLMRFAQYLGTRIAA